MHPKAFEHLVGRLLSSIGFEEIEVTPYSNDGGIDVRATLTVGGLTRVPTAVQVKRLSSNIPAAKIRELRGSMNTTRQERGLFITTSDFTRDACEEAKDPNRIPISLVNGDRLVDLLIKHQIGARMTQIPVLTLAPEDLEVTQPPTSDDHVVSDMAAEQVSAGEMPGTAVEAKKRALWPLPGGNYYEALLKILHQVKTTSSTKRELGEWVLKSFPTVKKPALAMDYLDVVKQTGFTVVTSTGVKLTTEGERFLEAPTKNRAFEIIDRHIFAFSDTMNVVLERPGATSEQIHTLINERLGKQWDKPHQVRWRLQWLRVLDKVTVEHGRWFPLSFARV